MSRRLVDIDELTDTIEGTQWYHVNVEGKLTRGANSQIDIPLFKANDIFNALKDAPVVSAVEVVRCKDCEHYLVTGKCNLDWYSHKPDDYCSDGERRTDT